MIVEKVQLELTWVEYTKLLEVIKASLDTTQKYDLYNKVYTNRKVIKIHEPK
jgi:hypothetical protein